MLKKPNDIYIDTTEFSKLLEKHTAWIDNNSLGKQLILREENLSNIDFSDINLDRIIFKRCELNNSNFENCSLKATIFDNCSIVGANFKKAITTSALFQSCNLIESSFVSAEAFFTRFHKCDLRKVDFRKAALSKSEFIGSKLYFAAFTLWDGLSEIIIDKDQAKLLNSEFKKILKESKIKYEKL